MDIEDVRYTVVSTSRGKIRLGSVDAATIIEFLESDENASQKTFRLIAKSIVDEDGKRIRNLSSAIRNLKKKDSRLVVRLEEAVYELNEIPRTTEQEQKFRKTLKRHLKTNPFRCMAHKLAIDRGLINVDAMLRSLSWVQLRELSVYSELESSGEERVDLRFALLATVIAGSAGAKAVDGKPYTPHYFLRSLERPEDNEKPIVQQSPEQMEMYLNMWIDGANKSFAERGYRAA